MTHHYSVNITPLWTVVNRFQLTPIRFFDLLRRYLLNRNDELFNIELQQMVPLYAPMVKQAIAPTLENLRYHMDITDNLHSVHFVGPMFIIETINLNGESHE